MISLATSTTTMDLAHALRLSCIPQAERTQRLAAWCPQRKAEVAYVPHIYSIAIASPVREYHWRLTYATPGREWWHVSENFSSLAVVRLVILFELLIPLDRGWQPLPEEPNYFSF